jgi:hypothetical protein
MKRNYWGFHIILVLLIISTAFTYTFNTDVETIPYITEVQELQIDTVITVSEYYISAMIVLNEEDTLPPPNMIMPDVIREVDTVFIPTLVKDYQTIYIPVEKSFLGSLESIVIMLCATLNLLIGFLQLKEKKQKK